MDIKEKPTYHLMRTMSMRISISSATNIFLYASVRHKIRLESLMNSYETKKNILTLSNVWSGWVDETLQV